MVIIYFPGHSMVTLVLAPHNNVRQQCLIRFQLLKSPLAVFLNKYSWFLHDEDDSTLSPWFLTLPSGHKRRPDPKISPAAASRWRLGCVFLPSHYSGAAEEQSTLGNALASLLPHWPLVLSHLRFPFLKTRCFILNHCRTLTGCSGWVFQWLFVHHVYVQQQTAVI